MGTQRRQLIVQAVWRARNRRIATRDRQWRYEVGGTESMRRELRSEIPTDEDTHGEKLDRSRWASRGTWRSGDFRVELPRIYDIDHDFPLFPIHTDGATRDREFDRLRRRRLRHHEAVRTMRSALRRRRAEIGCRGEARIIMRHVLRDERPLRLKLPEWWVTWTEDA